MPLGNWYEGTREGGIIVSLKKVRVTVSHEFEVPEDWVIESDEEDCSQYFVIGGKSYLPTIGWMRFLMRDEDGSAWDEATKEVDDLLPGEMKCVKETIVEVDSFTM